jgi:nucleoid-associated protein YgaU
MSSNRAIVIALIVAAVPGVVAAQSLAGSTSSINRMYRQAKAEGFSFFETGASLRRAVNAGALVRLDVDDRDVELHEIGYPYVRPATLTFVRRLGAQYHEACDESLVITSAARPSTRQPPNSTARSVHPTGMAIDLRRPRDPECLSWLRDALLGLERKGLIEATEEHSPAHFHVAVFATPYARYVVSRARSEAVATYVVRAGDTLSEIAREHEVTLKALVRANGLDEDTIVPGQELKIPNG